MYKYVIKKEKEREWQRGSWFTTFFVAIVTFFCCGHCSAKGSVSEVRSWCCFSLSLHSRSRFEQPFYALRWFHFYSRLCQCEPHTHSYIFFFCRLSWVNVDCCMVVCLRGHQRHGTQQTLDTSRSTGLETTSVHRWGKIASTLEFCLDDLSPWQKQWECCCASLSRWPNSEKAFDWTSSIGNMQMLNAAE